MLKVNVAQRFSAFVPCYTTAHGSFTGSTTSDDVITCNKH